MKTLRIPVLATHITGWLLFQSLPLVFLLGNNPASLTDLITQHEYWLFCLYYIAVFYLHSYWLLPRLLNRKKWVAYGIALVVLLAALFALSPFEKLMSVTRRVSFTENRMGAFRYEERRMPPDSMRMMEPPPEFRNGERRMPPQGMGHPDQHRRRPRLDIMSTILFIMIITLSVAIDLTRRWRDSMERATKAEADKANAELSFLKAQINPHFLFNTLNNIYSMSVTRNEHTPEMIMKLSNIMRYVTDDVNEDFVSLQSEIDCITDYVDLQQLRLGKKVSLDFSVSGELGYKKIAPLVLMTFIENVFKYGTSNHEQSQLVIRIDVSDSRIDFFTSNPLFATEKKLERTGIGISNTRKRLEHLYPGKYKLDLTRAQGMFTVQLSLCSV